LGLEFWSLVNTGSKNFIGKGSGQKFESGGPSQKKKVTGPTVVNGTPFDAGIGEPELRLQQVF